MVVLHIKLTWTKLTITGVNKYFALTLTLDPWDGVKKVNLFSFLKVAPLHKQIN